jgi:hypothetical protein
MQSKSKHFMKRTSAFVLALLILLSPVFASDSGEDALRVTSRNETSPPQIVTQPELGKFYDCTFTIKGTFDGVKVNLEITVYDITWAECGLLKLGVKKAMK